MSINFSTAMRFFFFNNMTSNNQQIRTNTLKLGTETLKLGFHPNGINNTLQQITDYENNKKYGQNPKIQEKSPRKYQGHLNHKLFSKNIFYDSLTIFSKPTGAIVLKIM